MPVTPRGLSAPSDSSSEPVTAALRGVAIAAALLAHYRWNFLGADQALEGYGNAALALFFVAGGYGNALSLRGRHQAVFSLGRFYFDRFLGLYPLYWTALAAMACLPGPAPDAWAWLGLRSPYWFVHAMVQCVVLAPFCHALRRRHGAEGFLSGLAFVVAGVNAAAWQLPEAARALAFSDLFAFRGVVLGHVALFGASMLLPDLVRRIERPGGPDKAGWRAGVARAQALAAWLVALLLLGATYGGFSGVLGGVGLFLASLAFAAALLSGRAQIPWQGLFAQLGRAAFAMYLFEPFLFRLLLAVGTPLGTLPGVAVYAGAFPVFALACRAAQLGAARLARLAGSAWPR